MEAFFTPMWLLDPLEEWANPGRTPDFHVLFH